MKELIYRTIQGDINSQYILYKKAKEEIQKLFENIKKLSDGELIALGQRFKEFPFGCDLNEIMVDVVSLKQEIDEIRGGFRLVDRLGFPIHVCSYVVAELAEREGKTPLELMKELRALTSMPIDIDHFGQFGPMRYPEEIAKCPAYCYRSGKPFNGCPRGRIHKRLIEKERCFAKEKEGWSELVQSISVSLMAFQKNTVHAASPEETLKVIDFAKSKKKGVGAIICVGNGKDELLRGLKACIKHSIDEIVIEGGPYNTAPNRVRAFGETVVMARIIAPGKIVATNGQYEDELRFGLKCGLNSVISGFPGNHHAYMSGYKPEKATIDRFGLPKIIELMAQELKDSPFPIPADRESAIVIAKSAKFLGKETIYPNGKLGDIYIGDAHWFLLLNSPLAQGINIKWSLELLTEFIRKNKFKKVGLLGGRFIAWGIAKAIDPFVKEILVSDKDKRIENTTVKVFKEYLSSKITRCNGNDDMCIKNSEITVLCSFIPSFIRKFKGIQKVITLES
ncbi:Uncharacterized conserved protein UCP019375 [Desulfurobacterium thermolithotrophum DSM 11699]|uniref:Uncharacterized conserved protein UCP019375 n=1 Tax=Desulfurobacterium thermolithotrophum (strain DSM 11699 / BSA) TaxID=868864 RepID=F0S2C3_DESTD|nr:5,10-methenyltetrahydromethanopterin hydrogenase cofactor biosynthesis protein HmdC [Desulfurobacterium thermolithotrophum]ADY74138.1 Uncharacterized conserved protein UCP019375 [Desulfurobacterium thermolithotrophum DSM 11699]